MGFWRLNYHLVWATKNRENILTDAVEIIVYPYIVNKANELGAYVYAINGVEDHIHLIVSVPPPISISQFVKRIKGASSHYVNSRKIIDGLFTWQKGYGVLSLGEKQKKLAIDYVEKQKEHHWQKETVSWLERESLSDEGPPDHGLTESDRHSGISEGEVEYLIERETLF